MPTWLETEDDEDVARRQQIFWQDMRSSVDRGEFWADEIKKLRHDPASRLELAMRNFPLPAAFRDAAIATRALIRAKRKAKEDWSQELGLLYWLAAMWSFHLPRADKAQVPGFNVMELVPGKVLKSLEFHYELLGYRQLTLLNKTDVAWLVEKFGEPQRHTTLNALHRDVWDQYENLLISKMEERQRRFAAEIDALLRGQASGFTAKEHSEALECGRTNTTLPREDRKLERSRKASNTAGTKWKYASLILGALALVYLIFDA